MRLKSRLKWGAATFEYFSHARFSKILHANRPYQNVIRVIQSWYTSNQMLVPAYVTFIYLMTKRKNVLYPHWMLVKQKSDSASSKSKSLGPVIMKNRARVWNAVYACEKRH
jgi:hypothetical protein